MTAQQEQVGLREMATIAFPGTEAPGLRGTCTTR